MNDKRFSKRLLIFFVICQIVYIISFYFILYPLLGLSYRLIVKGMVPSFSLIMILLIVLSIIINKISRPLDNMNGEVIDKKSGIEKIEKKLKIFFYLFYFVFFPIFSIAGFILTLFADGLMRWSTIRLLILNGFFFGPTIGIMQITYLSYILKDVRVYYNIDEIKINRSSISLKNNILINLFSIGIYSILFLFFVGITVQEKTAGISNVAFFLRYNAEAEKNDGYFTNLLELAQNSSDDNVKNEAVRLINGWKERSNKDTIFFFIAIAVAILYYCGFSLVFAGNFSSHIKEISIRLKSMVNLEGDLTKLIVKTSNDEIGEMQVLLNQFILNINKLFSKINKTAQEIVNSTKKEEDNILFLINSNKDIINSSKEINGEMKMQENVYNSANSLVNDFIKSVESNILMITDQSSMIAQTSSSTEEMHSSIESIGESTNRAFELGKILETTSDDSASVINDMNEIISDISAKGNGISDIVTTILSIADTTDILALNAAIEAAHAGEAGKGFVVVADEIRKLSENTANQTMEISALLNSMKDIINSSVKKSNEVSSAIQSIQTNISSTIQIVDEINSASKEELIGANENIKSIQRLVEITSTIMNNLDIQKDIIKSLLETMNNLDKSVNNVKSVGIKQQNYFEELNKSFSEFNLYFNSINIKIESLNRDLSKLKLLEDTN